MKLKTLQILLLIGLLLVGCKSEEDSGSEYNYTLNVALTNSPKAWNPHTWETSDENYIPSYTTMGLYQTGLSDDRKSFKILNEMALSTPVDAGKKVSTAEKQKYGYTGQLNDAGLVYDVELNPAAKWEDGTPIKAKDYVESLKRLLSPNMSNFRADTFWASNFVVANAEAYYKQGRITSEELYKYIVNTNDGVPTTRDILFDNTYILNLGLFSSYFANIFPNQKQGSLFNVLASRPRAAKPEVEFAAKRILDAVQYYIFNYVELSNNSKYSDVKVMTDLNEESLLNVDIDIYSFDVNKVLVRTNADIAIDLNDSSTYEEYSTNALKEDLTTFVSNMTAGVAFQSSWCWKLPLFAHMQNNNTVDFDEVGLKAVDDYALRFFLKQKMTVEDLQFSLTSNWLVRTDLYDKLTKRFSSGELSATAYATDNANNYMSYGPYKLESFQKDKAFVIVKNPNWYGYHDGKHVNQYQCDRVITQIVANHETEKIMFMKGELDTLSLNKSDTKDYGRSSRIKYVPEPYTQKISFNSDRETLRRRQEQTSDNDNKTILNNLNFRKALSLAIDRREFANNATAGSQPFTGLLNNQYMINAKNGETYRSTAQGKSVYKKVYGQLGGDNGGTLLNPDETGDNHSGYNKNLAIKLVKQAIEEEKLLEDGYRDGQTVTIQFLTSQSKEESETVRDGINYLESAFNAVTEPNGMHVSIINKKDGDYYNTANRGAYDMIYSIWGGATNNPYGLMQVYIDANFAKNCEYGFKGHQGEINLEIEFSDGSKTTKTYYAWFDDIVKNLIEPSLSANPAQSQLDEYNRVHNKRLDVLAGVEAGVLSRFEAIPLVARSEASLNSYKVEDGTQNFVTFVGYGGIRETKFNFTDAEWDEFLSHHNYDLAEEYKK
ncbi:MAG: hypothetical protein K6E21_04155 [Bacilli bacterium]|nr:hypothetical protein [Bacilli bacterium]